jgi:ribosome maturation factor RimP
LAECYRPRWQERDLKSSGSELERLRKLAQEVVEGHKLSLYDVILGQQRGRAVVRVYVDRDTKGAAKGEGVTVGECAAVSRELSQIFDVEDPLPYGYLLEVSSPGVERALKEHSHYRWAVGERIEVVLSEEGKGTRTLEGVLESVNFGEEGTGTQERIALRIAPKVKAVKGRRPKVPPMEEWEIREIELKTIHKAKTVFVT